VTRRSRVRAPPEREAVSLRSSAASEIEPSRDRILVNQQGLLGEHGIQGEDKAPASALRFGTWASAAALFSCDSSHTLTKPGRRAAG